MKNSGMHLNPVEKPHILLAEDDPDQSDMLRDVLESEGFEVETVFSGDVALRRLTERKYAAAVMDARMPGQHGGTVLKVCSVMKNRTPIIMVSAFATPADMEKFKRDGAKACLAKPIELPELLQLLREIILLNAQVSVAT